MKKKGNVVVMKQSRSASDITQEILDRKDEFRSFRSRLGTRSLSHDSIFLTETRQSAPKPPWVLSQETAHGKIQALQIKLQRQKMRLGPPPLLLPIKQTEDNQQPSEVLTSKNLPHKSSTHGDFPYPISPTLPPVYSSAPSPGVDFSTLPQLIPCLDNSAARHRMSIKPRNQRASTKSRRTLTSDGSRPRSESMIILERPLTLHKEEDRIAPTKEMTRVRSYSSQIIRSGKGCVAPPTKSPVPSSPPKLLVEADDNSHPHAVSQCKGKEEPAVSNTADGGTKEILKLAEGIVVERFSSSGPNSHKGSVDHKESLSSSKPKDVECSAVSVSSVYNPCLISSGNGPSQLKSDKELNMVTTQVKGNASNRNDPRVQDTMQEYYLQGQPLKPLKLKQNTSPLNNKSEGGNVNQISSLLLSKEEGYLQESTNQQQSLSFSVSSDKSQERQRTGSFTVQIKPAEGKQERVFPLIKPPTNLNTQDLHKNAQEMVTGKDPSQTRATSTPAVLTKPRDLTIDVSAGQERRDRAANKTRDMALATQIGVKNADEANKKLKMNKVNKEQKEERSASELKLLITYPSEVNDKQQVRSTSWLPEFTTPIAVGQNDSKVEPVRETVFKSPPSVYKVELFSPAESPVFSSIQPQSARRDQERAGFIRFPDLQASTQLAGSTITIPMSTPVHVMETNPLQTSAKDSREAFTELSWMTLAREKTRSLQQLFTSTLNELAGLQTVTRPAASTLTHVSSQCSAGPINPTAAQPSVSPLETQLPSTVHASLQTTHPIQSPLLKSSISLAHPSIDQSGGIDVSTKPTSSPTSQVQPIHLNARSSQLSAHSTLKPVKSTGIDMPSTQIIHATQQQLSQMPLHQAYPIQQSLSQSVAKAQASQSLRLSHNPKRTPRQPPHQSLSPVSSHRPLVKNIFSLPLEKVDWTTMPQEKSPTEGQAQYAGGFGGKALLIEQWHHEKPDTVKVDQKSTQDSRTYQFLDEFPTISSRRKFTELAVSPRPMRLDREVKWQRKTFSPSSPPSSSHLQSNSESRQPSWMDLAQRKSMAWSDKSMD